MNLVHVGEIGGVLDSMLARLAMYMEKAQALKHRVQMAIVYPILVMTVAILVVAFLLVFIIPIFAGFFDKAGVPLPLPTRIVIALSNGGGEVLVRHPARCGPSACTASGPGTRPRPAA